MVDDIRSKTAIKSWGRRTIFTEPNGFKVDYEEINEVPYIHFTFITKKVTPSLFKMMELILEEVCSVLFEEGYDDLRTYTADNNRAIIRWAKSLGFKEEHRKNGQLIMKKEIL